MPFFDLLAFTEWHPVYWTWSFASEVTEPTPLSSGSCIWGFWISNCNSMTWPAMDLTNSHPVHAQEEQIQHYEDHLQTEEEGGNSSNAARTFRWPMTARLAISVNSSSFCWGDLIHIFFVLLLPEPQQMPNPLLPWLLSSGFLLVFFSHRTKPKGFTGDSGNCRGFLVQCGLHFELQTSPSL